MPLCSRKCELGGMRHWAVLQSWGQCNCANIRTRACLGFRLQTVHAARQTLIEKTKMDMPPAFIKTVLIKPARG